MSMADIVNSALKVGLTRLADCFPVTMTWLGGSYSGVNGTAKYSQQLEVVGDLPQYDRSITFKKELFGTLPKYGERAIIDGEDYKIVYVEYLSGGASINILFARWV